jgi:hypothetical protein
MNRGFPRQRVMGALAPGNRPVGAGRPRSALARDATRPPRTSSWATLRGLVCLAFLALALVWTASGAGPAPAAPAPELKAQLVWATDEPKPADKPLKDVEQKLGEKLRRLFRWKNYWEINSQPVALQASAPVKVTMSPKCLIEVRRIDDSNVEIKLWGEGRLVRTLQQSLRLLQQGEYCIIGGDDKDKYNDAWLVVLSAGKPA